MQLGLGTILLFAGLYFASFGRRPFLDYDFILVWYGFLLLSDLVAKKLSGRSVFSNIKDFLILAFSSSFFWIIYEWVNLYLKNWAYPVQSLYSPVEWQVIAFIAYATVIPNLIISSNIVHGLIFKGKPNFIAYKTGKFLWVIPVGIACFLINIVWPIYFFPLVWFGLFLILDPINLLEGRRSIIAQIIKKNYRPVIVLAIGALLAGFFWETINLVVHRWVYPIVPWFWKLPPPATTKYVEMPLAGFLGYIPFIFSAFAFVEFLSLPIKLLGNKKSS